MVLDCMIPKSILILHMYFQYFFNHNQLHLCLHWELHAHSVAALDNSHVWFPHRAFKRRPRIGFPHTSCRGFEGNTRFTSRLLFIDVEEGIFMFEHWHFLSFFIVIHLPPPIIRKRSCSPFSECWPQLMGIGVPLVHPYT